MASDVLLDVMLSRNLKVRGGIISQANGYLGGFCSSQRIFPPQIIQVLLLSLPSPLHTPSLESELAVVVPPAHMPVPFDTGSQSG